MNFWTGFEKRANFLERLKLMTKSRLIKRIAKREIQHEKIQRMAARKTERLNPDKPGVKNLAATIIKEGQLSKLDELEKVIKKPKQKQDPSSDVIFYRSSGA